MASSEVELMETCYFPFTSSDFNELMASSEVELMETTKRTKHQPDWRGRLWLLRKSN